MYSQDSLTASIALPKTVIDSIASGTDTIALPPAEHWRVVMPGALFNRSTHHLVRAEGCYIDVEAANQTIELLTAENQELKAANQALKSANAKADTVQVVQKILTRKEKRQQWWKTLKKIL